MRCNYFIKSKTSTYLLSSLFSFFVIIILSKGTCQNTSIVHIKLCCGSIGYSISPLFCKSNSRWKRSLILWGGDRDVITVDDASMPSRRLAVCLWLWQIIHFCFDISISRTTTTVFWTIVFYFVPSFDSLHGNTRVAYYSIPLRHLWGNNSSCSDVGPPLAIKWGNQWTSILLLYHLYFNGIELYENRTYYSSLNHNRSNRWFILSDFLKRKGIEIECSLFEHDVHQVVERHQARN